MTPEELIVSIGRVAERKFGLTVGENPHFGGVDPVHKPTSWHYKGLAIDVTGSPARLAAFNRWVARNFGDTIGELFYDGTRKNPGINIKSGSPTSAIGGHGTHVHVAVDPDLAPDSGGWDIGKIAKGALGLGLGVSPAGLALLDPVERLQALDDVIGSEAGDKAAGLAGDVIEGLARLLGVNGPAIALNVALVGGGAALVFYGVAKMAGVDEPVTQLYSRTPAGAAVGAVT